MKDYKKSAEVFLKEHNLMVLATVTEDGQPMAHTVGYAEEGAVLYFSTDKSTQKVKNILANPKVGYTIDMDEDTDWGILQGLQMLGKAFIVEDPIEAEKASELLLEKFPQLANMPQDLDLIFIKVIPVKGRFFDSAVHFGFSADLEY